MRTIVQNIRAPERIEELPINTALEQKIKEYADDMPGLYEDSDEGMLSDSNDFAIRKRVSIHWRISNWQ